MNPRHESCRCCLVHKTYIELGRDIINITVKYRDMGEGGWCYPTTFSVGRLRGQGIPHKRYIEDENYAA